MNILIIIFILFTSTSMGYGRESRVVNTEVGPVRGYEDTDVGVLTFYGIPYAKAPTGRQRFKAPLPAAIRTEVLDAVDNSIMCPQHDSTAEALNRTSSYTEDCLIANIFMPKTNNNGLPVVVYVHGGGYVLGSGDIQSYKYLVKSKNVIVVTFNYRLGPHGFLCLGTEDIPGNAGMKDQVALLRWVQRNIRQFGGNPEDVTLAGYSAGSASVELLSLSKTTNGLFSRIIPESGSATAVWSVQTDPIAYAKRYAELIKFTNSNDFYALEEYFKTVSYDELFSTNTMNLKEPTFLVSPCVERDTEGEEFLTEPPVNILKKRDYVKLPALIGFADREGLLRLPYFDQFKDDMNNNFADFLPPDLYFENGKVKNEVVKKIRKFYFGDDLIVNEDKILGFIDYFSDVFITYPTLRSIKLRIENGDNNIYLYEYLFVSEDTPPIIHTDQRGADHCAQSFIIADGDQLNRSEANITQEVKDQKKLLRGIWYNFIKTGKPVSRCSSLPPWPPVDKDWSPHMKIDKTLTLGGSLLKERTEFWDEIYDKHYRHPSPPSPPPQPRVGY